MVIPKLVITEHDRDGDGLKDTEEGQHSTHSGKADTDGDGLPDGYEVYTSLTDPRDRDTDRDGVDDFAEVMDPKRDPLVREIEPGIPTGLSVPPDEWRCDKGIHPNCFVKVTGSTFLMGAQSTDPSGSGYDPAAEAHEGPPRKVRLSTYWIAQTEANVSLYMKCVQAGACAADEVAVGGLFNFGVKERTQHPINGVTWQGASDLCTWLDGRLPTEAEWEFAARGVEGRRWPWGDEPGCGTTEADAFIDHAHRRMKRDSCENNGTVESFNVWFRSPADAVGMAGNVWEWTSDWYAADAYARGGGSDPAGPETGTRRVQRGGGWSSRDPLELRSAARASLEPAMKLPDVGFRCVWKAK